MVSFGEQLRILLWKNWTIRKRNVKRVIIEIIWPLTLFLILMWVRTRGLKFRENTCHVIEKALPSVGGFEFFQNFVCTLNNTCYDDYVENTDAKRWDDAIVVKFMKETSPLLTDILSNDVSRGTVAQLWQDALNYMKIISSFQSANEIKKLGTIRLQDLLNPRGLTSFRERAKAYTNRSQDFIDDFLRISINLDKLEQKNIEAIVGDIQNEACDANKTYELLTFPTQHTLGQLCSLSREKMYLLLFIFSNYIDPNAFQRLNSIVESGEALNQAQFTAPLTALQYDFETIRKLGQLGRKFMEIGGVFGEFANLTGTEAASVFIYEGLCGIKQDKMNVNVTLFGVDAGRPKTFDTLRDRLKEWNPDHVYEIDKEISPACNAIFSRLESMPVSSFMWRQVKPLIRGYIYYAPDNEMTRQIMENVEAEFSQIKNMEITLNSILQILHRVRLWIHENLADLNNIKTFLGEKNNIAGILKLMGIPTTGSEVERIYKVSSSLDGINLDESLEQVDFISELLSEVVGCVRYNNTVAFPTEWEAVEAGYELLSAEKLWAVVVFSNMEEGNETGNASIPSHLYYKIRMDSDKVDGTRAVRDRLTSKGPRRRPLFDLKYITYGFVYLQEMIERSVIEIVTGADLSREEVYLQQYPYPCYVFDQFIRAVSRTFPLFMVLSWVYASAMIIKSVVLEKERRLREVMKIMGVSNLAVWTSWFIESFIIMFISSSVLTLILKYGKVIEFSNPIIIWVFLISYTVATICFSFLVSTFFSRANSAAAAGGVIFFVSYLPYNMMLIWEEQLEWFETLAGCLISNVAFGFGCTYFARYEQDGAGAQWSNLSWQSLPEDGFNLSYCIMMLWFDAVLYLFLTWYLESVFPGEYGVPRPWNFFAKPSYWLPNKSSSRPIDKGDGTANDSAVSIRIFESSGDNQFGNVEAGPDGGECGVRIQNLSKTYSNGKKALDNLSMEFYENQITSFLGHNGAGKTTTISILTGLFPPSKGTAIVNGLDIRYDMDKIRRNLGICPQYNVLFDRLNVYEHLEFYALLKGKKGAEVEKEFDQILYDLGIPHKRNAYPSSLSGGMKRKLSVAIAFVGGSKTVFLDEPTSGVDPFSRRSIWELLLKYKAGRTVILTTHFMDEADILGDRIAIISQGKLKALGSSLFLKSHFGQGYTLHLVKTENFEVVPDQQDNEKASLPTLKHENLIEKFVQNAIPDAIMSENVGSEIAFLLPYAEIAKFSDLFTTLSKNLDSLGILSFGISDTSLEDVFLKITVEDLATNAESFHALSASCKRRLGQILNRCKNRRTNRNEVGTILPPREPSGSTLATTATDGTVTYTFPTHCMDSFRRPDDVDAEENETRYSSDGTSITNNMLFPMEHKSGNGNSSYSDGTTTSGDTETVTTSLLTETVPEVEFVPPSSKFSLFMNKWLSCLFNCHSCSWINQIQMIIWKRFWNSMRNKKAVFFEIILPAVFIAITLAFTLILPPVADEQPREVTPWAYQSPNNIFFSEPSKTRKRGVPLEFKTFLNELIGPIGMGTACLADQHRNICDKTKWDNETVELFNTSRLDFKGAKFQPCNCDDVGTMQCSPSDSDPQFPTLKTQTNDYILDVSNTNIPEWLLIDYDKHIDSRYGGFELQLRKPSNSLLEYLSLLENLTSLIPFPNVDNVQGREKIGNDSRELTPPFKTKYAYKVWYENRGWLSSIAYLNALHNMWLRGKLPDQYKEHKDSFGITLITHPMNLTESQSSKENLKTTGLGVIHAICIIFALSFIPASFTVYLIEERKCGGKHLHLVSGVRPITYWIGNFLYDMMKYLIPTVLCLILFAVFDAQAYIGKPSLFAFLSLLLLYGWASIPSMYPFSFLFGVPSTAFVVLACSNLFIGVVTTVSTFVLDLFRDEELEAVGDILKKVFLIFPHYCLGRGCIELVKLHMEDTAVSVLLHKHGSEPNRFDWEHLGEKLVFLAIHGFVYFIINLLIEYRYLPFLLCKRSREMIPYDEDVDVVKERERVKNSDYSSMSLSAINLTKYYHRGTCGNIRRLLPSSIRCCKDKSYPAVNGLTFGIGKGECFGLLGVNGAGKSSTFKMLTGDVRISSGNAQICGADVETHLDQARTHFGYCPQEDSIDPLLTGYELLVLYGRLRGLSAYATDEAARRLIRTLGLSRYANRSSGTYSGGNKRKLSTGIALIGDPDVIFLDEPTSGMDPGARRDLWRIILELLHKGKSVVITSHSMEECEVLCTKIAIMVNGEFKCLGSLQHLKNRFGKGYTLTIRCVETHQDSLLKRIADDMPLATIEDQHCLQMKLNIPQESAQLSEIFRTLSKYKSEGIIEDYSVSQTTLDDIFVRFASQQKDYLDETGTRYGDGMERRTFLGIAF